MTNPYEPPQSEVSDVAQQHAAPTTAPTPEGPKGIGGWLILVVIGLAITPLRTGYQLFTIYVPMIQDGSWTSLTTPGEENYHALWAPLLIFEMVGNVAIILFAIVTLVFMFRHSRRTPMLAISFYTGALLFVVIDYFVADLIPAVAANPDPDALKEVARSVIAAAIWIPYFKVSKRVKATFVK